jgi:hypothetical protein
MSGMRGDDRQPDAMFSDVSAEQRVPQHHPLRAVRALIDDVLRDMSREFDGLYALQDQCGTLDGGQVLTLTDVPPA